MRVLLHYKTKDFDPGTALAWNEQTLTQDLELTPLFQTMAGGDELLLKVARATILSSLPNDAETIAYRQAILADCLRIPELARELYAIAVEAIEARKKTWYYLSSSYPSSNLSNAVGLMELFTDHLDLLRVFATTHGESFASEGFRRLLGSLRTELAEDYITDVRGNLQELRFRWGTLMTARLGAGNSGMGYSLRRPAEKHLNWWQRLFASKPKDAYVFNIHPRDESGARALAELKNNGVARAAEVMAGAAEHVLSFFAQLETELAFYLGCLNLADRLKELGEPICLPELAAMTGRTHAARNLYDVSLALNMRHKVVDNDLEEGGTGLVIITGANQGGKSTFLRSIGVAQLMMQSGMFVPAERFSAGLCRCLFTHFKREEDTGMKSGKFDEEMSRMSGISDHITPDAIGLFNESFAATNEREGSEIAGQIVRALREKGVRVFFVTHQYAFAHALFEQDPERALFLRAERKADTGRTFKLLPGEPLPTSYAIDIYNRLFPAETLTKEA